MDIKRSLVSLKSRNPVSKANGSWKTVLEDLLPTPPESPSSDNVVVDSLVAGEYITIESPVTEECVVEVSSNDPVTEPDSEALRFFHRWNSVELNVECNLHNRATVSQPKLLQHYVMNDDPVTTSKCPLVKDCMWSQPVVIPADIMLAELSRRMRSCRPPNLPINNVNSVHCTFPNILTGSSWNTMSSSENSSCMTSYSSYNQRSSLREQPSITSDDQDDECQILSDDDFVNAEVREGMKDGTLIHESNRRDVMESVEKKQQIRLVEHLDEIHSYCYKARKPSAGYNQRHHSLPVCRSPENLRNTANEWTASLSQPLSRMENSGNTGCPSVKDDHLNEDIPSRAFKFIDNTRDELQRLHHADTDRLSIESLSKGNNKKTCSSGTSKRNSTINSRHHQRLTGRTDGHRHRRLQHNVLERNRRQDIRKQFSTLQALISEYDRSVKRVHRLSGSFSTRMARVEILDRAVEVVKELEHSDRQMRDTLNRLSASNRNLETRVSAGLLS